MNITKAHIIKTQEVEITFQDGKQNTNLPSEISLLVQSQLNKKMSVLFDELMPKGHLAIDNLEIDLGVLSQNNWEEIFVERTLLQLKNAILEQKPSFSVTTYDQVKQQSGKGITDPASIGNEKNQSIPSLSRDFLMVELHSFLLNGFFTWRNYNQSIQDFELVFIEAYGPANELQRNELAPLFTLLSENEGALNRFILQFSDSFISYISESLKMKSVPEIFDELKSKVSGSNLNKLLFVIRFWQNTSFKSNQDLAPSIRRVLKNIIAPKDLLLEDEEKLQKVIDELLINERNGKEVVSEDQGNKTSNTKEVIDEKKKSKSISEKLVTQFISNSGLVILYPYLSTLFRAMKLTTEDNLWINALCQRRAVLITQYLVTGKVDIDESTLLLNKFLCGVELDEPIERELILLEDEEHLCNELLEIVISRWAVIKSTSVEGLRNSFLMRDGQLSLQEESAKLIVEQKAWDVLLAQLPWGIGVVRTPWMKGLLHTTWC